MAPKSVFATINSAFREFELEVNYEKTEIIDSASKIDHDWVVEIRQFFMPRNPNKQRHAIEHYFKRALALSSQYPSSNILKYAVARSRSFLIHYSIWRYYESHLLRIARINHSCVPGVAQILINENYVGRNLDLEKIGRFINDLIVDHSIQHHWEEVAWALFVGKALRIPIGSSAAKNINGVESGVCALISLDLAERGLMPAAFKSGSWNQYLNADGFRSRMWLVAYEAPLKGWVRPPSATYLNSDDFVSSMFRHRVSFYDSNRNVGKTKIGRYWRAAHVERTRRAISIFRSLGLDGMM